MDTVECPFCEEENEINDEVADCGNNDSFDKECVGCEREFEVSIEVELHFHGSVIEYETCEECDKLVRHFNTFMSTREKLLCYPCLFKELKRRKGNHVLGPEKSVRRNYSGH